MPLIRGINLLKALAQLQEKTAPKPKSTIAAADRYHPFTDKAAGESRPVTREEVSQIVSQVIRQELRGQNSRHANYQNTRGRRSFQGQPICDFGNRSGHVLATCRQRLRQMQGQTPSSRDHESQILIDPHKQTRTGEVQIVRRAHKISNI